MTCLSDAKRWGIEMVKFKPFDDILFLEARCTFFKLTDSEMPLNMPYKFSQDSSYTLSKFFSHKAIEEKTYQESCLPTLVPKEKV